MTRDELIEHVARAMAEADSGPQGSGLFGIHWQEFGPGYLDAARVAVLALLDKMETPSEGMGRAGLDVLEDGQSWLGALRIYRVMIAAFRKEITGEAGS